MINRIKEILRDCYASNSTTCQVTTVLLEKIVAELEALIKECGECHGDQYLQPCNTCGRGINNKEFVFIHYGDEHPVLELADGSKVILSKDELITKEKELLTLCEITKKKLDKLKQENVSLDKQYRLITWAIEQENKIGKKHFTFIVDGYDYEEWVDPKEKIGDIKKRILVNKEKRICRTSY
jgi:hypothetical protein